MLDLVDVSRSGLLLYRDERRWLAIVHLSVPELVAEAIEMGDGQPMKGQPNEIRGALRTATRRRFAHVHHVVQSWYAFWVNSSTEASDEHYMVRTATGQ